MRILSLQNSWRCVLDVFPRMLAMALMVQGLMLLLLLLPLLLLHCRLPFFRPRESDRLFGRCRTRLCAVPHKGGRPPRSLLRWFPGRLMSLGCTRFPGGHRAKLCMAVTRELRAVALMAEGWFCSSSAMASSWHMPSSSVIIGRGPAAVPYKAGVPPASLLWLFFLPDIHQGPQSWVDGDSCRGACFCSARELRGLVTSQTATVTGPSMRVAQYIGLWWAWKVPRYGRSRRVMRAEGTFPGAHPTCHAASTRKAVPWAQGPLPPLFRSPWLQHSPHPVPGVTSTWPWQQHSKSIKNPQVSRKKEKPNCYLQSEGPPHAVLSFTDKR